MSDANTESTPEMTPLPLAALIESLLFVSSEPVPVSQLAEALDVNVEQVEDTLAELKAVAGNGPARGLMLQRKGDKVQLTTRPESAPYIEKFLGLALTSRLSKPALETLAIIAYQQPVTRPEIEMIRGVNCDGVIQTLLSKGLVEEVGRLETAGRPIQYGTTFAFLQHFGLRSLEEMPPLEAEPLKTELPRAEPLNAEEPQASELAKGTEPVGAAATAPPEPAPQQAELALPPMSGVLDVVESS